MNVQNRLVKLDSQTVRRISSGQVIISMAAAVKELIENSLDAGASCLTIRFIDFGKELIEVADNGFGIEESNFQLLGQRNCTSKLSTFDDLDLVNTFGFRGEALNSLCNLANVKIHTRHTSKSIGDVLVFDTNGLITQKDYKPREIGTTVSLLKLFVPLPVRRKEFLNNIRRSFDKTLSLIYQYCLGMNGCKIIVLHQKNSSGTFGTVFTSKGYSIQSNIIDIFDYKQFSQLIPFVCDKNVNDSISSDIDFDVNGFISKPDSGCGRSSTDRQYFYINQRPCDLPDIAKKINQIYRTYNRNQYPFILLSIKIDEKLIDRNFTPDKRKILLADNHYLMKIIQNSVEKMFCPENKEVLNVNLSQKNLGSFLKRSMNEKSDSDDAHSERLNKIAKNSLTESFPIKSIEKPIDSFKTELATKPQIIFERNEKELGKQQFLHPFLQNVDFKVKSSDRISNVPDENRKEANYEKAIPTIHISPPKQNESDSFKMNQSSNQIIDDDEDFIVYRKNHNIDISLDDICRELNEVSYKNNRNEVFSKEKFAFKAQITPEDDDQALKELIHVFSRQSFSEMNIIGQFNHGFIIAEYQKSLFIIDQHASDERFNYENLLNDPLIISHQNLVCPLELKLSAIDEMVIIDNLPIFDQYGFRMKVELQATVGQRIKVTRIPIGKEWTANQSDIEELIVAIRDCPSDFKHGKSYFIFSGLKREIAYRACRSSVMIGEPLSKNKMKKLLCQMSQVRDPWHCAHNRPTIRHLISLDKL